MCHYSLLSFVSVIQIENETDSRPCANNSTRPFQAQIKCWLCPTLIVPLFPHFSWFNHILDKAWLLTPCWTIVNHSYLVGGLEHVVIIPYIGNNNTNWPINIFQMGGSTTKQLCLVIPSAAPRTLQMSQLLEPQSLWTVKEFAWVVLDAFVPGPRRSTSVMEPISPCRHVP